MFCLIKVYKAKNIFNVTGLFIWCNNPKIYTLTDKYELVESKPKLEFLILVGANSGGSENLPLL